MMIGTLTGIQNGHFPKYNNTSHKCYCLTKPAWRGK